MRILEDDALPLCREISRCTGDDGDEIVGLEEEAWNRVVSA